MKKLRTHYDNLKVSRHATTADIRKSYRRLASLHHPDKNGNSPASIKAMQCINKAYEVLSSASLRAEHDKWIEVNDYSCIQSNPSPTAQTDQNRQFYTWPGFNQPVPPPLFDPNKLPPRNWNPEHYAAFARYSQAMMRLLDHDDGEHVTIHVLYRAFLMDKRLGNLNHTNQTTARASLNRSFTRLEKAPWKVAQWVKRFRALDQPARQTVIISSLVTIGLIYILC